MADSHQSVPDNVVGDFFVDSTCIDCDTCRQVAPQVFAEGEDTAFVHRQPQSATELHRALQALVCCPTGSIGCRDSQLTKQNVRQVMDGFPLVVEEPVYYCGFNSPKSYGGNSYFLRRAEGNWLIDSPKFLPQLVRRLESLGGVANIFLTHRDDVADAARYAEHFASRRFIHRAELSSQPEAEVILDGFEPQELAPRILSIPTPGHTAGHCVFLVDDLFLFTGDHLDWDRDKQQLAASRNYCWHSWPQQIKSMRALLNYRFEWVMPGHGQRVHLSADDMNGQLRRLIERMERDLS